MINTVTLRAVKDSVLSDAELHELFLLTRQGNTEAREKIISSNLRLVMKMVNRFSYLANEQDDLFQIGCIALIKAVDNFDLNRNLKFSTYAIPYIFGHLRNNLRDNNPMKITRDLNNWTREISKYKREYQLTHKDTDGPSNDEIMKHFDLDHYQLSIIISSTQAPVSLNEIVTSNDGDEISYMDILSYDNHEETIFSIDLENYINTLPLIERTIIHKRFIEDKTQKAIAIELNMVQAQVSRIENRILNELKKHIA